MSSRVQGGAASRPWWHNPDLDMPVEDIATFYRDHTNKLAKLQKQKEKERKKEQKKKSRKARKRARGEETSSSDSDKSKNSSSSGSEDYDSDMEKEGLDLNKDLRPLTHYPTRGEICENMFKIIHGDAFVHMIPEKFRHLPKGDIEAKLREQMDGLSRKRINHVLQFGIDMDFSSGESDVDSEEEVERFKKSQKEAEKNKQNPIQSSQIDSTEDLVVPRIEDLDKMSLEDITALREKIRRKVETVQEEEKVSQAEKQAQDQDYEYQWAEKNEDEEETDAAIATAAKNAVQKPVESSSEESDSDDSSDEEISEVQLKLKAKALALAKAKIMQAKRLKLREEMAKKAAEEAADDSDVSVDRTAPANDDSDVSVNRDEENDTPMETNEEQALVPTEKEEAPEFEYATGVAPNVMYQSRSPEQIEEPEKTTEELQEELQSDLKERALKAMNKRKFEKLKAKAQAVEVSTDDDEESEEEPEDKTAGDETGEQKKTSDNSGNQYRSGYDSGDEK